MQFLKLVLRNKLCKCCINSTRVVVVVRGSIDRVFNVVEVTREDRVASVVVVSERIDFSKPEVAV